MAAWLSANSGVLWLSYVCQLTQRTSANRKEDLSFPGAVMFDLENFCASIARSICHWRHYAVDKSVFVLTSTSSFLTFFLPFVLTRIFTTGSYGPYVLPFLSHQQCQCTDLTWFYPTTDHLREGHWSIYFGVSNSCSWMCVPDAYFNCCRLFTGDTAEQKGGVPDFWLQIFKNTELLTPMIQVWPICLYLVCYMEL